MNGQLLDGLFDSGSTGVCGVSGIRSGQTETLMSYDKYDSSARCFVLWILHKQ